MGSTRHGIVLLTAMVLAACQQQADGGANNMAAEPRSVQASDVAAMLARAGLPVTDVATVTAATDPDHLLGQPGQYTSKVSFSDGGSTRGRNVIEVFASPADAMRRAEVVTSGATDPAAITQYQAVSGKVYLRLDEALPPEKANRYLKRFAALDV